MKLILYIRKTSLWPVADQLKATAHLDIHFTVIEGEDGRDFSNALRQFSKNSEPRALLICDLSILGRRRDTVCDRISALFAKGARIVEPDGHIHEPSCEKSIIKSIKSRGLTARGDEPKPRVAHNKTADEDLKDAKRFWTQKQFRKMTNKDIAEATGISVVTLTKEFGKRSKYVETGPGRPKSK